MAYNKIIVNDDVVMDLTTDTVTSEDVKAGVTFHTKSGDVEVGTLTAPAGIIEISTNGIHDVTNYASANVDITPTLQEKTATENGEVVADDGYDGLRKVVINVSSSGGEDMLQARLDATNDASYLMYSFTGDNVDFLENLDLSRTTNAYCMFNGCTNIKTIPELNTQNIPNMEAMFNGCSNLESVPKLHTDSAENLHQLFSQCTKLVTVPSELNTSKCTGMSNMFYNCQKLKIAPRMDVSNVTSVYSIFQYCSSLTSVSELKTHNVTSFSNMFQACTSLTTIPLVDLLSATNVYGIFLHCSKLTNLTVKKVKISLMIGQTTSWGHLLTDESLINTAKELWDLTGATSQTLTMSTASNARFDAIYVKLVDVTEEMIAEDEYVSNKKPCVVCESTDEGAMTLREYVISKNWALA